MCLYELEDIIDPYELSDADKVVLKLGSHSSKEERADLEPVYSDAVRRLRNASVQEAEENSYLMRGKIPPSAL